MNKGKIIYPDVFANPSVVIDFQKPRIFNVDTGVYHHLFTNLRTKESQKEDALGTGGVPSAVDEPRVAEIPAAAFQKACSGIIPGVVVVKIVVIHVSFSFNCLT